MLLYKANGQNSYLIVTTTRYNMNNAKAANPFYATLKFSSVLGKRGLNSFNVSHILDKNNEIVA